MCRRRKNLSLTSHHVFAYLVYRCRNLILDKSPVQTFTFYGLYACSFMGCDYTHVWAKYRSTSDRLHVDQVIVVLFLILISSKYNIQWMHSSLIADSIFYLCFYDFITPRGNRS